MNNFFNQISQNFVEFYRSLDGRRRASLFVITGVIIVAMIFLIAWAAKTQYKLLYTDLTNEDSLTIRQLLDSGNIAYRIDDDGKSIYVPEDMVDIWRLEIAKKGVDFNATIGYEVFDKQAFSDSMYATLIK